MTKTCPRCGRELPVECFNPHKTAKDGRKSICKDCDHSARVAGKRKSVNPLERYSKFELIDELKRRGFDVLVNPMPRDLMLRLKQAGFVGELQFVETKVVNLKNIE